MKPTAMQLTKAYLPTVLCDDVMDLPDSYVTVGMPPDSSVFLFFEHGNPQLRIGHEARPSPELVLHELCHALCGPKSLHHEGALMALQWGLMKLLRDADREECREAWSVYILNNVGIGPSDRFLRTPSWKKCVHLAKKQGVLTGSGRIPARLSVHSGWERWAKRMTRAPRQA